MSWVFREPVATLLLQEDGSVNLCLSVPVDRLRLAGAKPETLVASLGEEASSLSSASPPRSDWAGGRASRECRANHPRSDGSVQTGFALGNQIFG
jgi:hypothetical protein